MTYDEGDNGGEEEDDAWRWACDEEMKEMECHIMVMENHLKRSLYDFCHQSNSMSRAFGLQSKLFYMT